MEAAPKSRHCYRAAILVAVLCTLVALPARAQTGSPFGTIEGAVRDETGGALPGVTVEVLSPALLERSRSAVTEPNGNYRFLRLPVGEYTLKFSLPGFATVQHENVKINADFTATINAVLKVASLEETVTVSGVSPMVDVRSTTTQTVVTAEIVNTIPSSRNIYDMSKFVLGASTSSPDVGGATTVIYNAIKVHGSRSNDRSFYIDGFPALGFFGGGDAPFNYSGSGAKEEIDYQTTAIPAWVAYGGVAISTVTKSGGNKISADVIANKQAFRSTNLDDNLRSRGVRATSATKDAYDVDGSIGGPIKKDRAWFFASGRVTTFTGLVANTFFLDGSQASEWNRRSEWFQKASVRINQNNRITASNTNTFAVRPYRREGANFVTPEAANFNTDTQPNLFPTVSWNGTRGNAWLYEVVFSNWFRGADQRYRPEVGPNDVARLDIVQSILSGAPTSVRLNHQHGHIFGASVTRVGNLLGSHEMRTGFQLNGGRYDNEWVWHGDIILRFRNGAPDSVDLQNTPAYNSEQVENRGVYVQENWRLTQRLSINAGVRYDNFHTFIPDQSSPAGTWVPAREFAAIDAKTFQTVVPRLGVAYDVTGNASTVIKGSYSMYAGNEGIGLADSLNPLTLQSNRCVWSDLNRDLYAQANEISSCAGFTGGVTTRIDPELRRPFNREYSLGMQRQLTTHLAGSVMYYRRENRNLRATRNEAVPSETYIPVVINNPLTNQPLTIYNQNPATSGRQNNILTNSSKLDTNYNGIELAIQRRFSADAYLQGGYHYGKDLGRISSGELNDPNDDIFTDGAVGNDEPHQVKLSGAILLPWRISVSGFFQAYSGHPKVRTLSVGRALVPTLTRATQTVRLERNDENRYDSNKLIDLRVGRRFVIGSWRLEAFADAFNLTNANTILTEVTTIGSNLGSVSQTISPRVVRLGGKFSF